MTVIIVENKNIPRNPLKKVKSLHDRVTSTKEHLSQTKAKEELGAEEFKLPDGELILVGDTGNNNVKAKVLPVHKTMHNGFIFQETKDKFLTMPKSISNVSQYYNECRIYHAGGILRVIKGDIITVFKTADKVFFRIGKSHKELEREFKEQELAKIGVVRY